MSNARPMPGGMSGLGIDRTISRRKFIRQRVKQKNNVILCLVAFTLFLLSNVRNVKRTLYVETNSPTINKIKKQQSKEVTKMGVHCSNEY